MVIIQTNIRKIRELGESWYTPGANTVFYIKWDWSITDTWPNQINFTTQNLSFATEWDLTYIVFNNWANGFYTTSVNIPCPFTFNLWMYQTWWTYAPRLLDNTDSNDNAIQITTSSSNPYTIKSYNTSTTITGNTRINLVVTWDTSWNCKIYKQWVLSSTWTSRTNSATGIIVWYKKSNSLDNFRWRMSKIILESKVRTAEETSDYYDQTKSDYGIS